MFSFIDRLPHENGLYQYISKYYYNRESSFGDSTYVIKILVKLNIGSPFKFTQMKTQEMK